MMWQHLRQGSWNSTFWLQTPGSFGRDAPSPRIGPVHWGLSSQRPGTTFAKLEWSWVKCHKFFSSLFPIVWPKFATLFETKSGSFICYKLSGIPPCYGSLRTTQLLPAGFWDAAQLAIHPLLRHCHPPPHQLPGPPATWGPPALPPLDSSCELGPVESEPDLGETAIHWSILVLCRIWVTETVGFQMISVFLWCINRHFDETNIKNKNVDSTDHSVPISAEPPGNATTTRLLAMACRSWSAESWANCQRSW